jgi:hypothetical protein
MNEPRSINILLKLVFSHKELFKGNVYIWLTKLFINDIISNKEKCIIYEFIQLYLPEQEHNVTKQYEFKIISTLLKEQIKLTK